MTDWRICPECDKTFRRTHPHAIWHGEKLLCSRQCREDYIERITTTFHPLHEERNSYQDNPQLELPLKGGRDGTKP